MLIIINCKVKSDYISDLTDGIFGDVKTSIYQNLLHIQFIRVTESNTMRIYNNFHII